MEEIKTTTDNFSRPTNPIKSFEAKYVNNQIVESLVLADVYDKYPIQATTFRKYLFEDTTSNTAQMVIGSVKAITKGDYVIADVEINAKFADKINEQEFYLQVMTRFNKDENVTRVTGYRLIKVTDYETMMKAKQQNKSRKLFNKKK